MGGEHVFSSTNYYYVTMCSVQLTDDSLDGRIVDLGAGWIHGIIGNPMSEMARRLNVELHHIPSDTKLYDAEGNPVPETQDRQVEEIFNKMLAEVHADMAGRGAKNDQSLGLLLEQRAAKHELFQSTANKQLFFWHCANIEYSTATDLHNLSAKNWSQVSSSSPLLLALCTH
jgi:hypothetical protein